MEKIRFPKSISCDLAEEIGWHIGDGSMNYYINKGKIVGSYSLRGHIEDDKLHYIQRVKPLFKKLYHITLRLHEMPSTGVFGFQIWNSKFVSFKKKLGLPLGKKEDITIPKVLMKINKNRSAVLRGIFDTDGCIYLEKKNRSLYPRMHIGTISKKLAKSMVANFRILGFRTTLHHENQNKIQRRINTLYVISIRGKEMFNKFMKEIKPQNPKHIRKYLFYKSYIFLKKQDKVTFINKLL